MLIEYKQRLGSQKLLHSLSLRSNSIAILLRDKWKFLIKGYIVAGFFNNSLSFLFEIRNFPALPTSLCS